MKQELREYIRKQTQLFYSIRASCFVIRNSNQGYIALMTVIILSAVVMSIATTVSLLAIGEAQSSLALFKGEDTLQFVEGCMEDALLKSRNNASYAGGTITRPEGTCIITVSKAGTTWTVVTTTANTQYVRTIQAVVVRGSSLALNSWQEIVPGSIPTATPTPLVTPTPAATPTPTPLPTLAQDTFQRSDQSHWGTASDGQTWSGSANTASAFSISSTTGKVISNGTSYDAILGPSTTDAQVLFSGSISSFSSANFGSLLRWTDTNNWYKAYIDGSNLIIQKKVGGTATIIQTSSFAATAGTNYTLRFQVVGTTLSAKVWKTTDTEPASWTGTIVDTSLSSGNCGLRMLTQGTAFVSYTSFTAISL